MRIMATVALLHVPWFASLLEHACLHLNAGSILQLLMQGSQSVWTGITLCALA